MVMLLCYSGTGNSYSASKTIQEVIGGEIADIGRRVTYRNYTLNLNFNEPIGFVFPVYYGTIPKAVKEFVLEMKVKNNGQHYLYAVMTCGSGCRFAPEDLASALEKSGLHLDAYFTVVMPNNALIDMEPEDTYTVENKLEKAETELGAIIEDIIARRTGAIRAHMGEFKHQDKERLRKEYEEACNTELFESTDDCIGCGFCERLCPERVIKVYGRNAAWEKDTCSLCMGCINMCPHTAITYGGKKPRGRYHNDSFYLKSIGIAMPFGDRRLDG